MGKPPRRPSLCGNSGTDVDISLDSSSSNGEIMLDLDGISSVSDLPTAWDTMDYHHSNNNNYNNGNGNGNGNVSSSPMSRLELFDSLQHDMCGPSLSNFASLDCHGWTFADHSNSGGGLLSTNLPSGPTRTPEPLNLGDYSSVEAPRSRADESLHFDSAAMRPEGIINGHDCHGEAYEILESFSFPNISKAHSATLSGTTASASVSTGSGAANNSNNSVPLDLVLRLNREAGERLIPLLTCSCARSLHLALLYASIVSRILAWYHQAAGCAQSPTQSPSSRAVSTALFNNNNNNNNTGGNGGDKSTSSTHSPGLDVAPAKMAIGTFSVDDSRLQTAMKIQLLSGEMRRVGSLIDQFSSHDSSSQCMTNEPTFGDVDSLYQSLNRWLKRDHSRIVNMMRSELRELNV